MVKFAECPPVETVVIPKLVVKDDFINLWLNGILVISIDELGVYLAQNKDALEKMGIKTVDGRIQARDMYSSNLRAKLTF